MKSQDIKSNYDEGFKNLVTDIDTLVIDLDGTIIDFECIDNMIIEQLFPNDRFIAVVDNILWKINRLDIIGNGYAALKLRLWFYSLISKKNFKDSKRKYGEYYAQLAETEFYEVYKNVFKDILKAGYHIIIATKNVYAKDILKNPAIEGDEFNNIELVVLRGNKQGQFKKLVNNNGRKICVVGNNFSDDILNSCKIGAPFIYIGKSRAIDITINSINWYYKTFYSEYLYKMGIQLEKIEEIKAVFKNKNEEEES